jgi:hypothetical protein
MFRSLRLLILIVQALAIVSPLLGAARRQKLPLLLKEGTFFVLTNWELLWKYLEKRNWSIETLKDLLKLKDIKK